MITQTIQVTIDLSTIEVPYTYAFSSNDVCVSFTNQTGTSSSTSLSTVVQYNSEECLEANPIYLQLIGSNGCSMSQQIQVANPCSNLTLNLTQLEDYKFQATASAPGCTATNFIWVFDDIVYTIQDQIDSNFTSTIELDFTGSTTISNLPDSSVIAVSAEDCNGCSVGTAFVYAVCKPIVEDFVKHLQCYSNPVLGITHSSGSFTVDIPDNCTSEMVVTPTWDLPDGFSVTTLTIPGVGIKYAITASSVDPGTYTGTYVMRTADGVHSNEGVITLVVRSCAEHNTITIPDKRINIDCNVVSPGDTITINVEEELIVQTGAVVDWSTWTLVDPPTPSSPSIVLTTNTDGDHVIEYETDSPTILNDVFAWTVCDTNGNCAQAAVYTVVECITGPTAVADADCVACNSSVVIDVLSNDTSSGPLDVNTVQIEVLPSDGTVDVNSDGTITYTPNAGFEGTDTFDYSVADTLGERSNDVTVTVTVICAGKNTTVTICNV